MTKTTIAAIYVRVSTQDQKHDMQLTELREYVARMGWTEKVYAEKESSMKKRPILNGMMEDARLKKIDVVVVWKMDRFARSLKQLMENITALDTYGVRFVAVTQGIDTDKQNPAGRLMMQIFGAFAEFERAIIVERVQAGVDEAKRQGKHCGRPRRIFRRDEMRALKAAGMSLRKIAAQLGLPLSTVADALKGK